MKRIAYWTAVVLSAVALTVGVNAAGGVEAIRALAIIGLSVAITIQGLLIQWLRNDLDWFVKGMTKTLYQHLDINQQQNDFALAVAGALVDHEARIGGESNGS